MRLDSAAVVLAPSVELAAVVFESDPEPLPLTSRTMAKISRAATPAPSPISAPRSLGRRRLETLGLGVLGRLAGGFAGGGVAGGLGCGAGVSVVGGTGGGSAGGGGVGGGGGRFRRLRRPVGLGQRLLDPLADLLDADPHQRRHVLVALLAGCASSRSIAFWSSVSATGRKPTRAPRQGVSEVKGSYRHNSDPWDRVWPDGRRSARTALALRRPARDGVARRRPRARPRPRRDARRAAPAVRPPARRRDVEPGRERLLAGDGARRDRTTG